MISVRPLVYERWSDAWCVSRADLEIVVVPSLGRILRFARPGGPNALWVNPHADAAPAGGWVNWGGEKIWFWPQSAWPARQGRGWPPPEPLGSAAEIEVLPDGLRWRLAPVTGYPFSVTRTLTLTDAVGSPVRIVTEVESGTARPWSVAQIVRPDLVQVRAVNTCKATPVSRLMSGPAAVADLRLEPANGKWSLACPASADLKLGFDADQLRARTPAGHLSVIIVSTPADLYNYAPAEIAQVFSAGDDSPMRAVGLPPYAELEFVSPPECGKLVQLWQLD